MKKNPGLKEALFLSVLSFNSAAGNAAKAEELTNPVMQTHTSISNVLAETDSTNDLARQTTESTDKLDFKKIHQEIVAILSAQKRNKFDSFETAHAFLMNILNQIHSLLSSNGISLPTPTDADTNTYPPQDGFLTQLRKYLNDFDLYFLPYIVPLKTQSGLVYLSSTSFNKIEERRTAELKDYLPQQFASSDFGGLSPEAKNTNVEVLILGINEAAVSAPKNNGMITGAKIDDKIIILRNEIAKIDYLEQDPEKIKDYINEVVIPNEMGHIYADSVQINNIYLQEAISDIFTMDKLWNEALFRFIDARLRNNNAPEQYKQSREMIRNAILAIGKRKKGARPQQLIDQIVNNGLYRNQFLGECYKWAKAAYDQTQGTTQKK